MNDNLKRIGSLIKEYRTQKGLSQEELSSIAGIERAQISKIELGLIDGVTFITVDKIVSALDKKLTISSNNNDVSSSIHPFVKWAGGKTQLLSQIESHLPIQFNTYYEPFVGGGALLFKLLPKSFVINDSNEELMDAFKCFKKEKDFKELKSLLLEHKNNNSEEYFYKIRNLDREKSFKSMSFIEKAARLIYLNKACFNGLYRVNSNGFYNVPYGKKKTVKCFDEENFYNIRNYFKNSKGKFLNIDFEKSIQSAQKGDFVYFDPPYDSFEDKKTFTSYDKDNFGKDEQIRLAKVYNGLSNKGVFVMLSNHNTNFIKELYKDFKINIVKAKRMINSDSKGRGEVEEVIITNYE